MPRTPGGRAPSQETTADPQEPHGTDPIEGECARVRYLEIIDDDGAGKNVLKLDLALGYVVRVSEK
jgi:hypothetical protein